MKSGDPILKMQFPTGVEITVPVEHSERKLQTVDEAWEQLIRDVEEWSDKDKRWAAQQLRDAFLPKTNHSGVNGSRSNCAAELCVENRENPYPN
jgi:hypothetical protein